MKSSFIIMILICAVITTIVISKQNESEHWQAPYYYIKEPIPCSAFCNKAKGYKIFTADSLESLQKAILDTLEKEDDWYPIGGVTYDPNEEKYLQVMIHPRMQLSDVSP